jgi:hypothetical protein
MESKKEKNMQGEMVYEMKKIQKNQAWGLFLLFGWCYGSLGQIWKQMVFYLTLGGFGVWALYVFVTFNKKINKANKKIRTDLGI